MISTPYACICCYCMLQLGFLIITERRRRNARIGQERYFMWMLIIAFLSFVADILSNLSKTPDWLYGISVAGNYFEIILNTLLIPIFFCYLCEQIPGLEVKVRRRLAAILWVLTCTCAAIVTSNAFTGQIFYMDGARVYHRGPLFMLPMSILLLMMLIVEVFLILRKDQIEARDYRALTLFLVMPLIGWALQSIHYGLPFALLGITFAAHVVFINIQNRNIDKDYLTGAFNRQTLDWYLQRKINLAVMGKTFSAILLDIDHFKEINDHYGHFEGDVALVNAVRILRESVEPGDLIARYGGDEFFLVLDCDNLPALETTVGKIRSRLALFEKAERKPYRLSFSMGYAVYSSVYGKDSTSFFKVIDRIMYDEKNAGKTGAFPCAEHRAKKRNRP